VLADRATAAVERVTLRGQSFLAMAEVMLGRDTTAFARTEATIERVQNKIACARVAQAQRQIAMAHVREQLAQANMQRKLAMAQMKMDKVRMISIDRANEFSNCAGFSKVVVNMPDLPTIDLSNLPGIQVPDLPDFDSMRGSHGNGPI
jgi:hypothetical protein